MRGCAHEGGVRLAVYPAAPLAALWPLRSLRAGHAGRYPRLPLGPCTAPARPGGRRARGRSGVTAFGFAPRRPTARRALVRDGARLGRCRLRTQVRAGRGRFKEHGNDGYTLTTRLRLSTI